ncbi:MIOREX complex component 2 [Pseudozyma hubeiensis]|nr:MIOREX complex component 2 [Pseudozyma hubeiensis]
MQQHTLLVVGGAGFLGSAISKAALAKGWRVLSISPSGTPYHTPAGHRPAWSSNPNIEWHAADALDPSSYSHLADRATAAVHTVGILLESDYKSKMSSASPIRNAIAGVAKGWGWNIGGSSSESNPLHDAKYPGGQASSQRSPSKFSYEHMNRDSAIAVAHTFLSSLRHRSLQAVEPSSSASTAEPAPFIYISAEDLFRPVVDARYIRTKRQAESAIARLAAHHHAPRPRSTLQQEAQIMSDSDGAGLEAELRDDGAADSGSAYTGEEAHSSTSQGLVRPVFLRPGLMYHPHTRPASTLPAAILEASAALHRSPPLPLPIPTPAQLIAKLGSATGNSPSQSIARLLTTPPLHIDTVAKAVCAAIEDQSVFGAVDVYGIRKLAGWKDEASLGGSVHGENVAGAARPWPSNHQQPFSASSRPASTHIPRHTATATPAGQQRSFFSLPDLGKLASSALSSTSPKAGGKEGESRSYRDAQGRTVYETSKILSHPANTLFEVVADVDAYKHFVPYCQDSRVLGPAPSPSQQQESTTSAVLADLTVGFGRFSETYTSQVTLISPAHGGKGSSSVVAEAVQPNPVFSYLETKWTFHPVDGGARTLVEFGLVYAFRNPVYGAVAGNVFEQMSAQMIDAFEQRANKLHPVRRS